MSFTAQYINTQDTINSLLYTDSSILPTSDTVKSKPMVEIELTDSGKTSITEFFTTETHQYITEKDCANYTLREGLHAEKRATTPADNPWVISILILAFAFFAISYRRGAKYLHSVFLSLFTINNRGNLFDETTINENQLKLSLLTLTFITEGIYLYYGVIDKALTDTQHVLPMMMICVTISFIYYILQKGIYHLLGNIFSDRQQTESFLDCYTSVNLFIGLFFTPFILLMLFTPDINNISAIACLILYILSRLIIIYKGIRFFLPHIYNSLYIILYLCALEIIPLLLITKLTVFINEIF